MIDTAFSWKGFGNGFGAWESKCRLRIYDTATETVVIATELPDNTGTSITNAAQYIATLVVMHYGLDPHSLVWIEHYPPTDDFEESFDQVTFPWDGKRFHAPQWRRLQQDDIARLTGGRI